MRFVKMHGIGNDYVYVNGFEETVDDPAALAIRVADRHFGIGGDGLILLLPPEAGVEADVRMRMFNADGSESEMCGNGIRCVCKLAHDYGASRANPMRIQTGNGVLSLRYTTTGGKVDQVTVDMGEPILEAARIPVDLPARRVINHEFDPGSIGSDVIGPTWFEDHGIGRAMTAVSMGNPHVVFYCDDVARVPLAVVGPLLEHLPIFPRRINVHFVQVLGPEEVRMITWERGSGITLACGTGASAVCVAGVLTGRSARRILAHLPGGDLTLHWREDTGHVEMTGPATEVFTGVWPG